MTLRYFQKGFNYSQDGPGNRLVYHLQGCNLHCPWCSNPEGMDACGTCGVTEADVQTLVKEALSCRPMMIDGGGVTLTGGEVLMQADAAAEFLRSLRAEGIHTAIETNASLPGFERVLPHVDYLICDCKHWSDAKYREISGDFSVVRRNLTLAAAAQVPTVLRIPMVHYFNCLPADAAAFCRLLQSLGGTFSVELLPYHEYGRDKWQKAGMEYTVTDGFTSPDDVSRLAGCLEEAGFSLIHT